MSNDSVAKLVVAYNGSSFHGFAEQGDVRTVAGELRVVIEKILQRPIELTCAGRTDRGVHAAGQVVSFPCDKSIDTDRMTSSINSMLNPQIAVRHAELVDPDFNARFSAKSRTYRFFILNQPTVDPLLADSQWWISQPLDFANLEMASDVFIGEHDFLAFCKNAEGKRTMRNVFESRWTQNGSRLIYTVSANSFCMQMVRSMVGIQVEAGLGKTTPADILAVLKNGDRSDIGRVAPPHGLVLDHVTY